METIFKSKNTIALFNSLNQGDEKETWYLCSLYAPAVNLKYNCGIKLTEEDLKSIAKKQVNKGLLNLKAGGKGIDGINAVYQFVIDNAEERGWTIPNLAIFKATDKKELENWIERGYMATIGIKVARVFLKDIKDGILDLYDDYNKYKGNDLGHFTNITRWKCRFNGECADYGSEQFIDSYAFNKKGNPWTYKCDINKVLGSFTMPTKYIFY